ncbi:MAG: hypothetical protein A3G25_19425 [Betaproteobacteria bacterium RIFCSPLOWO2_12_FULL_63_13]|nr:MAG: hypothetical protein A3G25_19425 [Betaproteobacteria bacterium RIFCSPLOWO2_12_FULL_63_13]
MAVAVNDEPARANAELDRYLQGYYMQPAEVIRRQQYCFTGGEYERQMELLAAMREELSG